MRNAFAHARVHERVRAFAYACGCACAFRNFNKFRLLNHCFCANLEFSLHILQMIIFLILVMISMLAAIGVLTVSVDCRM